MPYKNPEDYKKYREIWNLKNKDKLKAAQRKYRENKPEKIKENNKITNARRDENRKKDKILLARIADVKPVTITKLCSRCHTEIVVNSPYVFCPECGTKFLIVQDYEYRYSHGVRLKVDTA